MINNFRDNMNSSTSHSSTDRSSESQGFESQSSMEDKKTVNQSGVELNFWGEGATHVCPFTQNEHNVHVLSQNVEKLLLSSAELRTATDRLEISSRQIPILATRISNVEEKTVDLRKATDSLFLKVDETTAYEENRILQQELIAQSQEEKLQSQEEKLQSQEVLLRQQQQLIDQLQSAIISLCTRMDKIEQK